MTLSDAYIKELDSHYVAALDIIQYTKNTRHKKLIEVLKGTLYDTLCDADTKQHNNYY